jgi:hypothetical protein
MALLDLYEELSELDLMNQHLDLVSWVNRRKIQCILRANAAENSWDSTEEYDFLSALFDCADCNSALYCGGVQVPPGSVKGISRAASMPRVPERVVAKPFIIVVLVNGHPVRALVDSGSLGDLLSTTIADQLNLPRAQLADPITLQLAVQGSRSKINHSVTANCRYQDINAERTFYVANLSGYDMILGTSWLFQHKVSIGLNPARVLIGSSDALPLEGVATSRVLAGSTNLIGDALQAAREELLDYARPICRVASDTPLPLLRAINHTIPFIDEAKILPWRPSRCPEALRPQWDEKRKAYLNSGRWKVSNSGNTAPMLLIPTSHSDHAAHFIGPLFTILPITSSNRPSKRPFSSRLCRCPQ